MTVAYKIYDGSIVGATVLTNSDATQTTQLGTILKGFDTSTAQYGEGEFQYVKFTGACVAGDFVLCDRGAKTCVQLSQAAVTATKGSVGISMATQASGAYGWVMIRGIHDGANVATGVTAGTALGATTTAGRAGSTSATYKLDGAYERVITSASNVGTVGMEWPFASGNG
jgi:hypothetical protein